MEGLAIPEGKRGHPDSERSWQKRLSSTFASASLACSLSFWLLAALYYLQAGLHIRIPAWRLVDSVANWQWVLFEDVRIISRNCRDCAWVLFRRETLASGSPGGPDYVPSHVLRHGVLS